MTNSSVYTIQELMAIIIAREIKDREGICVGTHSPIPAAGCWLAQEMHVPRSQLAILGSWEWPFTDGTEEFFDYIQRGDCDLFFLSGAQIDRNANINLHAIGDYRRPKVRLPGGAGSAMIYYMARRTILFCQDHSHRNLVEKVDFVSASGAKDPGFYRRGLPSLLVTPYCNMRYEPAREELALSTIHPGLTPEAVQEATGWPLQLEGVTITDPPSADELKCLRSNVKNKLLRLYPEFALRYINKND